MIALYVILAVLLILAAVLTFNTVKASKKQESFLISSLL